MAFAVLTVAAHGPDVLYDGKYTAQLVEEIRAVGGVITEADLRWATSQTLVQQKTPDIHALHLGVRLAQRVLSFTSPTADACDGACPRRAEAVVKPAMRADVLGLELVFPPPPSSAVAIVTALNILAGPPLTPGTLGTLLLHPHACCFSQISAGHFWGIRNLLVRLGPGLQTHVGMHPCIN